MHGVPLSLNALVYRSRATLDIDVESMGAVKDERTGEFYFSTSAHDGRFPREAFIAREYWIGNVLGVAELRQEISSIIKTRDSILLEKVLYSGTHSGDVIELVLVSTLEREIRGLLQYERSKLSAYVMKFLRGMLDLIETAKAENNPIVFV